MKKKVLSLMTMLLLAFSGLLYAQAPLPYSYGFEEEGEYANWTRTSCNTQSRRIGGQAIHTGSWGFQFQFSNTTIQYLISPELTGVTGGVDVEFYYKAYNTTYFERFRVGYSTTTNEVASFTWSEQTATVDTDWHQYTIVCPAGTKYIAIECGTGGYYLFLDDFVFTDIPLPEPSEDPEAGLHVAIESDEERGLVIDNLNLGQLPAGTWMEPVSFKMFNDDTQALTVSLLDFTPNTDMLSIPEGITLPFTVAANAADSIDLAIDVHIAENVEAGDYEYQFVAIYEGSRLAKIWPLSFSVYTPEIPDVVEKPLELTIDDIAGGYSHQPSTMTELHDDYTLPFPEIPDGYDAVYKFSFDTEVMLSAHVENGNNGKVALYTEDFYGEPGPMAHNAYFGPRRINGSPRSVLFDQTQFVTHEGIMPGNTNASALEPVHNSFGPNINKNSSLILADDFTLSNTSVITGFEVYGYQTGSTTTSTMTGLYAQIYDGDPRDGGEVIWGNMTDNLLSSSTFTGCYRTGSALTGTTRPIMSLTAEGLDIQLEAGTYWIAWAATGSTTSGPWGVPVTIWGQPTTGNGAQYSLADGWGDYLNTGYASGGAFRIDGNEVLDPVAVDSMTVLAGTYYLVASSTDQDFIVVIDQKELPCPEPAVAISPADDEDGLEPASVTLNWQLGRFATEWRLVFGSTYWPDNEPNHPYTTITEWSNDLSQTSYTITGLRNNTNYFWRIDQRNNGEDGCTTTGEVWGFTTHLNKPHNLTANPINIYEGQTTTLSWSTIEDRTFRQYNIYKDGAQIGNTQETPYPNVHLSYLVPATELTYNPAGYTFNVTAVYDEGESDFSNSVVVKVAGYSASNGINGYVYEQDGTTPIGGVTVTVTGTDEFGIAHTYDFVTNADGYYEGQVLVGTYTTAIATCSGYQDAEPYQNGPTFSVAHQASHDDMNFIMDEVFCPPFQVWAEYIDVDGTELVKVWWEPCHSDFRGEDATRALNHYRVYRTDCYNDGPFNEENTILLSTVWVPDTAYIDVSWPEAAPGVYKWGVGAVYEGNNPNNPNNLRESEINWIMPTAPRYDDATADNCEWDEEPVAIEGNNRAPWDLLNSFNASGGGQYGIATDGNFIYTSSWSASADNQFHKYDMDGNHIESFNLAGFTAPASGYFRDITYDGQYFYGCANNSELYCFDLANQTFIGSVNTGLSTLRHCSYDPVNDGFWVGGWYDLHLVSRTGAVMQTGSSIAGASGTAYYTAEDGSAHLYLFYQPASNTAYVYDYDIATGIVSDQMLFDFTTTPGYVAGTSGGCYIGEYNGTMAFFGLVQNTPGLIGIYDLLEEVVPPTPGVATYNELALPRESLTVWSNCLDKDMYIPSFDGDEPVSVNVLLNSADSPEGTTVSFTNLNEYEQMQYGIDPLTLDGTGHYVFDSFRRGRYAIEVYHQGYYTIFDTVNIGFEPDDIRELRYVMIEILYPVRDLYVSNTGVALWGITEGWEGSNPGVTPDPTPGDPVVLFEDDFEGENFWTFVDADGDAEQWEVINSPTTTAHSGAKVAASFSWNWTAFDPDNWMISPLVEGATSIHYYMSTNTVFHDHYGIFASSTGTNLADFTLVFDETPFTDKGVAAEGSRDGRPQSEWQERTVELPAGTKYVAFRHYDSPNMSNVLIEDVTIYGNSRAEAQTRHFQYYKVMCTSIDGESIFNASVTEPYCQLNTDDLVEGETYVCKVAAMFSTGLSPWVETEWVYQSCENFTGTVNGVTMNGSQLTWTYPAVENATAPDLEAAALVSDLTTNSVSNGYTSFGNRAMWDLLHTYETTTAYQYGIATDGNFIYHSAWSNNAEHQFFKYDLQGSFIEGFEIAGCGYLRGMAYDGQYFYGVANSNTVYCVDLANQTLVSSFTTPYGAMRCITYDPVRDGFWVVGNWSGALTLIDRTGAVQFTSDVNRTDISDVTYYNDENNVDHVFLFCQPGGNGNAVIYDYDIVSNAVTATPVFDVFANLPGASGSSGGCFVAEYAGRVCFFACLQGSPNLVGIYELSISTAPVPFPVATGEIIGAAIMLDGQIVSFVNYPTNVWTMPNANNEYSVCIIYNGEMDGTYFSMSCPELAGDQVVLDIEENEANVALFPNPTKGNVKIMAKAMRHITVVNNLGQVVYDADVNTDELDLNMARFNAGVYVVRVVAETGTTTQRVTVVR